jgi:hypothetical protein
VIHSEAKHGTGSWFCHGCAMFAPHFPSVGLLYILKRLETQACLRKNKQIRFQADFNPDFGLFVSKFAYSPFVSVFFGVSMNEALRFSAFNLSSRFGFRLFPSQEYRYFLRSIC